MVTWGPTWEPEELTIHADFEQKVKEYLMNKDPGPNLSAPTADTSLDNLARQGFSKDDTFDNPWHKKSDYTLRNKMTFDSHPTNPQLDIQPTGHCNYWVQHEVHEVCLMDHTDQNAQPHEQESQPTSYSTLLAACVYGADGKCKCMLTSKCLQTFPQKYNKAKSTGLQRDVSPPPQTLLPSCLDRLYAKPGPPKNLIAKRF